MVVTVLVRLVNCNLLLDYIIINTTILDFTIVMEYKTSINNVWKIDQAEEGGYGPPKAKFMRLD